MRYKKELIEAYKNKILINADEHPQDLVQYSVENLPISKNTVTKYIEYLTNLREQILMSHSLRPSFSYVLWNKKVWHLLHALRHEDF